MKNIRVIFLFILMILPSVIYSASFDCSKASSETEKLICANDEIGSLDELLSNRYKELISYLGVNEKKELRKSQREWLKLRNINCKDVSTCKEIFTSRILYFDKQIAKHSTKNLILVKWKKYTVPEGKKWIIKDVKPAECRVCTSDLYVDGGMEVGKPRGFTVYGKFEISFTNIEHSEIHLYAGTKVALGDTRESVVVTEVKD